MKTLPSPHSAWPADAAKRAAVVWGHTRLVICPSCRGSALVGYLDGKPVAYACHRCPDAAWGGVAVAATQAAG